MDAFADSIALTLETKGGAMDLSTLELSVQRPNNIVLGLKDVLERYPRKFVLEKSGQIYTVHLLQAKSHKFDDPSLKRMFLAVHTMSNYYRGKDWPSEREKWRKDYSKGMKLSSPSTTLFEMRSGGYVKVSEGTKLKWTVPKIYDAANRMPESLRSNQIQESFFQFDKSFSLKDGTDCFYIESVGALKEITVADKDLNPGGGGEPCFVALDCEGVPGNLHLMQIATSKGVYLIDCQSIGAEVVCQTVEGFLTSPTPFKLIHDLHNDALAIKRFGGLELAGAVDTQLVGEHMWREPFLGFNAFLEKLKLPTHPSKEFVHGRMKSGLDLWSERPIPKTTLEYAAMDVSFLLSAALPISLLSESEMKDILRASSMRVNHAVANEGMRSICFDKANKFVLRSSELMEATRPAEGFFGEPLVVKSEAEEVVSLLPTHFQSKFSNKKPEGRGIFQRLLSNVPDQEGRKDAPTFVCLDKLNDINLDVGRRAQCWEGEDRIFLSDDEKRLVMKDDIDKIVESLGQFGSDNRAGLDRKLHRFSAMRNRDGKIAGITIRIGRHVNGNAAMLMDFLMGTNKSILILGEPGSGKTTIVREATRKLAEHKNVIVVDTSNEIAGDGMVPHDCIGLARRMMVPSLDKQSSVMVECVQNHTPHVMVIDEIGRPKEVEAARTVKQRGVRMVASAHGDFRKLLKNKDLRGLVGGVESVTMGDDMARDEAKRKQKLLEKQEGGSNFVAVSKTKVQRAGEPTFEIIVEVSRESRHCWRIVFDAAQAVDRVLDGLRYKAQSRARDPGTGSMRMEFVEG